MIDLLAIYIVVYMLFALCFFVAAITISRIDCKEKNAKLSRKVYRVNYKRCIFKSLFFPLTIAQIIYELIVEARK